MPAEMRLIRETAIVCGVRCRPALAKKRFCLAHALVGEKSMRSDVEFLSEGTDQMGAAEARHLRKFLQSDVEPVVSNEIISRPVHG